MCWYPGGCSLSRPRYRATWNGPLASTHSSLISIPSSDACIATRSTSHAASEPSSACMGFSSPSPPRCMLAASKVTLARDSPAHRAMTCGSRSASSGAALTRSTNAFSCGTSIWFRRLTTALCMICPSAVAGCLHQRGCPGRQNIRATCGSWYGCRVGAAGAPMTHNGSMAGHEDAMAERRLVRAGVTEREAEVLSVVAERLRNREIASRLHISVRTVESHVAALLRKLGAADRTALAEMGAELRRAPRAGTVLPVPLTSLVGREGETSELIALLDAHRLVTLTGPAGVGKTRLALRIATVRAGSFPDGVRLADLAPVTPELAGDTLALALGVVPQPGWPLRDILREVAGGMHCLLLVDNCEHVITEAAEFVAGLLAVGGPLRVLGTSREPLGVPGEVIYQVPTLPVPTARDSSQAATAGHYDAVRLFADRAGTASPGFALTDSVAPAVAALCQRLDGLPLAIA